MVDSPADVSKTNRRPAARLHADGAIPRRFSPHTLRAVRARHLLPIDRTRPWIWPGRCGAAQRPLRILARAPLGAARASAIRSGAGVHARQWKIPALIPSRSVAAAALRAASRDRYFPL